MSEEYQVYLFDKLQDKRAVCTQSDLKLHASYVIGYWSVGVAKCDHVRYELFYGEELPEHAERFYGCRTRNIVVEKIVSPAGEVIYSEV